ESKRPSSHALLTTGTYVLARSEGGAGLERRVVRPPLRDIGLGRGAGAPRVRVEAEVDQGAEVIERDVAAGRTGEGLGPLHAVSELGGGEEGGDPAVTEAAGAPHRGLAPATDPDG